MQAAVYRRNGPADDVLSIVQLAKCKPGPGEVRVRVAFSGVNPSDVKARAGVSVPTLAYDYVVPHSDGSGIIDALGEGVSGLTPGAPVWFFLAQWQRQHGSAAEYVCLPASQVLALPDGVPLQAGAAIGIPLMTAWHAVHGYGSVVDKTVLVTGGAGAVGFYAIQLAKLAGARVIATVSSAAKADLASEAGADHVLEYGDAAALARSVRELTGGAGVDVIIEVNAGHNAPGHADLLAHGGRVIIYGSQAAEIPVSYRGMMRVFGSLHFFLVYVFTPEQRRAIAESMNALLASGRLRHLPVAEFALDEIASAHRHVEAGGIGKALLRVA
ncbi:NADPH:quinone reductase [Pseudoduganella sp. UC29_106]|uniref:NADPH:quinone reductase n=1 Tax=Pseudoduganella sp. UC29_106 TaxID=3374553 RepID=UPI003757DDAD